MTHLSGNGVSSALAFIIPGMQGHFELLIILFIVLLLFGGKRIPELARGLGRGIREFKRAKHEVDDEVQELDAELRDNGTSGKAAPPRRPPNS